MSDFIDPNTDPWGPLSDAVWAWMKRDWEANTPGLVSVPDTYENRIREYRMITQYWNQKFKLAAGSRYTAGIDPLVSWLGTEYEKARMAPPNHRGRPPRF